MQTKSVLSAALGIGLMVSTLSSLAGDQTTDKFTVVIHSDDTINTQLSGGEIKNGGIIIGSAIANGDQRIRDVEFTATTDTVVNTQIAGGDIHAGVVIAAAQ